MTFHFSRGAPLAAAGIGLALMTAACAARPFRLPAGPGAPVADAAAIVDEATAACRGVRTLQAELSISGRVGGGRLRGRVIAGFERPSAMRLEGVAPFGPPAFILVARAGLATLLMPRDGRLVADAPPAAVIEALAGVLVTPDDLRAILAGCLTDNPAPVAARAYAGGWAAVDLQGGGMAYAKQQAQGWRIVAGTLGRLSVEYGQGPGATPKTVRLRVVDDAGTVTSDLSIVVSQVETNVPIDSRAFLLTRPAQAVPMTIEELRRAGPLGQRR